MKKILLASMALVLFSCSSMTSALASEIYASETNNSVNGPKSVFVKIWFKGIPPKKI